MNIDRKLCIYANRSNSWQHFHEQGWGGGIPLGNHMAMESDMKKPGSMQY